jgi:hypothetical protein
MTLTKCFDSLADVVEALEKASDVGKTEVPLVRGALVLASFMC